MSVTTERRLTKSSSDYFVDDPRYNVDTFRVRFRTSKVVPDISATFRFFQDTYDGRWKKVSL